MASDDVVLEKGMLDLFVAELETQVQILNEGLVALEQKKGDAKQLESLMRAAHSIKGAARVVGLQAVVTLAHALEDYFVDLQKGQSKFSDALFRAVDSIAKIGEIPFENLSEWMRSQLPAFEGIAAELMGKVPPASFPVVEKVEEAPAVHADRVLRVTAHNLNRLMGLAGESMVEARWLQPFSAHLLKLKKEQSSLSTQIESLSDMLKESSLSKEVEKKLLFIQDKSNHLLYDLSGRLSELELFISRHSSLTDRLYSEVIDSRMRPFSEGVSAFPRMVRDLSRQLGKKVRLEITGYKTPVDRDILEKLEAPLTHLLRNAVDHGIESPEERVKAGKPEEGVIKLKAEHRGGMLAIEVSDDGRGVNFGNLRKKIIASNLAKGELAEKLTKQEILDFLFLPGFSTSAAVTEVSGRGMGLNIVQNMLQEVSGSIRVVEESLKGIAFQLSLPLTLSVIRALTVEIAKEPYAFPLARIDRSLLVPLDQVKQMEDRQYFNFEGNNIGLVPAAQVLEVDTEMDLDYRVLPVVVVRDRQNTYGLVVDCFLGERELVLQEIDAKLGKVPNISSGAFMEDGSPLLIIDVDDIISSIDNLLSGGRLHQVKNKEESQKKASKKRILVVDDSVTVREVESRLLRNQGYEVETAVNGMDAWNAVRMSHYDLVITDVDMPRMNGIELVQMIKSETRLKTLPIMIVSYKEREQDRLLGMEAGADYYMTKSSFHDDTLIEAVNNLIGAA